MPVNSALTLPEFKIRTPIIIKLMLLIIICLTIEKESCPFEILLSIEIGMAMPTIKRKQGNKQSARPMPSKSEAGWPSHDGTGGILRSFTKSISTRAMPLKISIDEIRL